MELWAPDISYFDGGYHLYYAFSVFGKNTSGVALLTNKTLNPSSPNFRWVDKGLVLRSRREDNFNAIDPNLVIDEKGQTRLAFGSFWIKMRQIDRKTGLLSSTDTKLCSLASVQFDGLLVCRCGCLDLIFAVEAQTEIVHSLYIRRIALEHRLKCVDRPFAANKSFQPSLSKSRKPVLHRDSRGQLPPTPPHGRSRLIQRPAFEEPLGMQRGKNLFFAACRGKQSERI